MAEWTIYVREGRNRLAQIDTFSEAVLTPRYNAVGSWRLSCEMSDAALELAAPNRGVEFWRDDTLVMSGPVVTRSRVFDKDRNGLDFEGFDDNVWLRRRVAHPEPGTVSPPYDTNEHDYYIAPASSAILHYVGRNADLFALEDRDVPYFTRKPNPLVGDVVQGRARFQNLLDFIAELATAGGVGFRTLGWEFEVYEPVDRSDTVVLSTEFGNLASYEYTATAPEANVLYVGGQGEGTARTFVVVEDAASVAEWGRIEGFLDRRDIADEGELEAAGYAALAEMTSKTALSFVPLETENMRYLVDYQLGDLVSVVIDGETVVDVVREAEIAIRSDGETITPIVGNADARADHPKFFASLARMARQLRNLERV